MGSLDFARQVFDKVFKDDIIRLRSMEDMWKTRKAPESLDFESLSKDAGLVEQDLSRRDQPPWSLVENFGVFVDRCVNSFCADVSLTTNSLKRLSDRSGKAQSSDGVVNSSSVLTFDKDDEDTLDFVASAANLRSYIFGIDLRSKFDIKRTSFTIL